MAIKLFVTDMDGTLLNSAYKVSEENKKAVREAVAAGVTVTIATGRMYASALPAARELGVDVPIITYNGALIKSVSGEVLVSSFLDEQDARDVLEYCLERGWHIQAYCDEVLYVVEKSEVVLAYEKAAGVTAQAVGAHGMREHLAHVPKMLSLLSIASNEEQTEARIAELNRAFGGRVIAMRSAPRYVEILQPGVNKASALKKLAAKLGIDMSEVMAIGDSNNDLPMLKAAGFSAATGNAVPEVKAAADVVVADCDHSGVADAIRNYVLR